MFAWQPVFLCASLCVLTLLLPLCLRPWTLSAAVVAAWEPAFLCASLSVLTLLLPLCMCLCPAPSDVRELSSCDSKLLGHRADIDRLQEMELEPLTTTLTQLQVRP